MRRVNFQPKKFFSFRCREPGTCLATAKHLKKHLKEKERARAILSRNRKEFPSQGPLVEFRFLVSLVVNPPDALACGFVAACEC